MPILKILNRMSKHEDKFCPRCGILFECKVGTITQCQCSGILINTEEQQHIFKQYIDCLCFKCIVALKLEYNTAESTTNIKKSFGH